MTSPDRPTIEGVLTRRRAILLGAGSLLTAALPGRAHARAAGLTVTPADFDGRVSRVLRAPGRFELLGLREAAPGFEVRARARGGAWSRWAPLGHGHGGRGSDPVWTGPSHELQLRARTAPRGSLRLHLVDAGEAPRRRPGRARAARAQGGPPAITPRAAWGADGVPPRGAPSYGAVQLAFVHHTVTANEYAPDQSAGIVLSIAKYHRDVNGWNDIGYNFLVDRYGQVFEGRAGGVDQAVVGAQCAGYNSASNAGGSIATAS